MVWFSIALFSSVQACSCSVLVYKLQSQVCLTEFNSRSFFLLRIYLSQSNKRTERYLNNTRYSDRKTKTTIDLLSGHFEHIRPDIFVDIVLLLLLRFCNIIHPNWFISVKIWAHIAVFFLFGSNFWWNKKNKSVIVSALIHR